VRSTRRRSPLPRGIAALLAASLAVIPAQAGQGAAETHEFRYMMGTSIEVQAFGADEAARKAAIDEAFAAFAEIDRLMSNYRDDSELSFINRAAANDAISVSAPMFSVLDAARRVSAASNGAFDVTVGPLVRLWGFHDKKPHLPTATELAAIRPLVNYRNVEVDASRHAVHFARPGVEIDLGGIAKGFAVEVAANVLRRYGLSGFIDAGGNQYLLGTPAGKRTWTVGIKNPDAPAAVIGVVETGEISVSTSADSYNFLVADGRKYGHILDPRTLEPADGALSVTVFSRDGTLADAMSKAAFILGPREGLALVDSFPGMSAVIAYRKPDRSIDVAISERLRASYRPVHP